MVSAARKDDGGAMLKPRLPESDPTYVDPVEGLRFWREHRAQELARDPIIEARLLAPDGTTNGQSLKCRRSHIVGLNEKRLFPFLQAQKRHEEARKARIEARKEQARQDALRLQDRKEAADTILQAEIPLPSDMWAERFLEWRKANPPKKVETPKPRPEEPESPIEWLDEDYLWFQVRMEDLNASD